MYKIFIIVFILISCESGIQIKGKLINHEKTTKILNVSIKIGQYRYTVKSNSDNKYYFKSVAYGDTIKIFVNDLQYYSDTLQFTWDEYMKNKLWEKDLDIYVRKKKNE